MNTSPLFRMALPLLLALLLCGCRHLERAPADQPPGIVEALELALPLAKQDRLLESEYEVTIRPSSRNGWNVSFARRPATPEGGLTYWVSEDRKVTRLPWH